MSRTAKHKAASAEGGVRTPVGDRASSSALDSLLRTAMLHHHSGRLDEAEAHYRRILKTAPKHPQTLHLLGMLHLKRGEPKKAIGALKRRGPSGHARLTRLPALMQRKQGLPPT